MDYQELPRSYETTNNIYIYMTSFIVYTLERVLKLYYKYDMKI